MVGVVQQSNSLYPVSNAGTFDKLLGLPHNLPRAFQEDTQSI